MDSQVELNASLLQAAAAGDLRQVQLCLADDADPQATDISGMDSLKLAALNGHPAVISALFVAGARDVPSSIGWASLHYACEQGHVEAAANLLQAAGVGYKDASDLLGRTALALAAENGHTAVVKLLLTAGVEIEARDRAGWTALHWAAAKGRDDVVTLLIAAGANVDAEDNGCKLFLPGPQGFFAGMLVLCRSIGSASDRSSLVKQTPLFFAARHGFVAAAAQLIAAGATLQWNEQLPHGAITTLAAAGYSDWAKVPVLPSPGLEATLLAVHQRAAEGLPEVFKRLEEGPKERAKTIMRCLHRCMPQERLEEKLLVSILQVALSREN